MKPRRKLIEAVELLREAQLTKPPRGRVTPASVERAAQKLLRDARRKRTQDREP
ncbi:MAG TPA: hypothetical protein VN680_06305 [Burkholderiaceae bacterium]|nr:hypothetical protein [Burkholderiaceae bacterium]